VNNSGIGEVARQCEPLMRQVFVTWENTAFTSPEDEQSFLEKVGAPFILHSRPLGRRRYDAATAGDTGASYARSIISEGKLSAATFFFHISRISAIYRLSLELDLLT